MESSEDLMAHMSRPLPGECRVAHVPVRGVDMWDTSMWSDDRPRCRFCGYPLS